MGKILCATRGGEASYRTQDAAIALAKEQGDTLIFLYVVDFGFLGKTAAPIIVDVEHELFKMGEFLLLMAQERAAAQGVEAKAIVRQGRIWTQVALAAQSLEVHLIVLGRPLGATAVFQETVLRALAGNLEEQVGIPVRIL